MATEQMTICQNTLERVVALERSRGCLGVVAHQREATSSHQFLEKK
jgi:hypothetical protein